MQFCRNWFENIVQPCRHVVPKYIVLNEGRTCLTKNSVLTDYLNVGLRVNFCPMSQHLSLSFGKAVFREVTHVLFTVNAVPFNSVYFLSLLAVHELLECHSSDALPTPGMIFRYYFKDDIMD